VIDTKDHFAFFDMPAQKGAFVEKVEHDAPRADLRVAIALGVILPNVAELIGYFGDAETPDQDIGPVHFASLAEEPQRFLETLGRCRIKPPDVLSNRI
jgi:hypothetical protein